MKNIVKRLVFVLGIISIIPWGYLYYYYPREVKYELAFEINIPDSTFDLSYFIGFNYVENKEWLMFYLIDFINNSSSPQHVLRGYNDEFVEDLSNKMDYERYDYLISYQKTLVRLQYSPYLTKKRDGLYFDKKIPLIPTWNKEITEKIYIYRIKKNNRFRAPGS